MGNDTNRPFAFWRAPSTPVASDFQRWDEKTKQAINAVNGGSSHAPTSPIVLGGSTVAIEGTTDIGDLTGGVTTEKGGRLKLGGSTRLTVSPLRTRSVIVPLGGLVRGAESNDLKAYIARPPRTGSFGAVPHTSLLAAVIPSRYLHQGATLSAVTMKWRATSRPAAVPTPLAITVQRVPTNVALAEYVSVLPLPWTAGQAYILNQRAIPNPAFNNGFFYRVSTAGTSHATTEPTWGITIGGTTPDLAPLVWTNDGYSGQFPLAATPDLYFNSGLAQTVTATCFQNNVIDPATYVYMVQIFNADATMILHSLKLDYTAIADLRPP